MITGEIQIPLITVQATLRQKGAFAVQHLMAAARFSKMCGIVERDNTGKELSNFYDEQIACVSANVMLCVASLESNINEFFSECDTNFKELPEKLRCEIFSLIEKKSILEKYQCALLFKGVEKFSKGDSDYQNAYALIKLINELVHFCPEWFDEQSNHKKIEQLLKGKFPINPFIGENGVFFPQQFVSYGCTIWAVKSALNFMRAFSALSGLPDRFDKFSDRINPEIES